MRRGDVLIFRRVGILPRILGWILERIVGFKFYGWHTGILIQANPTMILEVQRSGLHIQERTLEKGTYRSYRWFDKAPRKYQIAAFFEEHANYPYDYTSYLGTTLSLLWMKLTGSSWRIYNTRFTCWEMTAAFARYMGKPLQPIYEWPLLPSMEHTLAFNSRVTRLEKMHHDS